MEKDFSTINAQKLMDIKLKEIQSSGKVPTLFLHSCCAPCSSYVLEYLSEYFEITVFYYNPNIEPETEYGRRIAEQKRLISLGKYKNPVHFEEGVYENPAFHEAVRGLEKEPEGGDRCTVCFEIRLGETARRAAEKGYDYFTTTLSISPHKNAARLNRVGSSMGDVYGVCFLPADFKKKGGYYRSIELSKEYGLYRQDYCGCIFSLRKELTDRHDTHC